MWLSYVLIGSVRALLGATPRWIGSKPEATQRIYFANHSSHIDAVALWSALPRDLRARTRPAAAADYWGRGAIRRAIAIDGLNAVLIDRKRTDPQADPLRPLYETLERGDSIIIFPEGTRTARPLPGPFKSGLSRAALSGGRVDPGLSGKSASQHAQGDILSDPADLRGALWRAAAAPRR